MKWLAILVIPVIMSGCRAEPPKDTLGGGQAAFTVTFSTDPAMLAGGEVHLQLTGHKPCAQCGVVYEVGRFRTAWTLSFTTGYIWDGQRATFMEDSYVESGESPFVSWRELCPVCYGKYSDPVTHEYLSDGVRKTWFWGN